MAKKYVDKEILKLLKELEKSRSKPPLFPDPSELPPRAHATDEELAALYDEGKSASQIADITGYHPNTVKRRLKSLGLPLPQKDYVPRGPRVGDDVLADLAGKNKSMKEIAEITGYTIPHVRGRLLKLGVKFRCAKIKKIDSEELEKMLVKGYKQKQIAEHFGVTPQAVSLRIKKLRKGKKRASSVDS